MKHCLPITKKLAHTVRDKLLRKTILKSIILIICCALASAINAQQKKVWGRVISGTDNTPLVGASVQVKGTDIGTTTDESGNFSLNVPENAVLQFGHVGFTEQEVPVGTQASINVTLVNTAASMNEVVVIGYQTVRRRDVTGATAVVNAANANRVSAASVGESIQGLAPGVTVRSGGGPGQNSRIEIRGVASFRNSDPLYVIDGMIADANSTVNTNDVESIQILKDASAAAIYGSRAANGVIIITTRKGKSGPPRVTVSARYGIQQIPKKWDMMNNVEFANAQKTQYQNSNRTPPVSVTTAFDPSINTDWQNAVLRTGNVQDYNVGISGGSSNSSYLISGSFYRNEGVLISNSFERASLRVNTEAKKGRFTIGENMVLSNTNGWNPGGGVNAFYEAPQMLPIIPVQSNAYKTIQYNPAGWGMGTNNAVTYASNYVAVSALDKRSYNYGKLVGNAYLDFKFTKWLNYRLNAGLEVSFDNNKEIRDTGIWRYANQPPQTSVSEDRQRFTNVLLEHTLNFNKSFGDHSINGVVGYSQQEVKREVNGSGRTGLQTLSGQTFTTIDASLGTPSTSGGTPEFYRIRGFLGRINYTYTDRYLLTLSGRIDQDSRFGQDYRTGYFPAGAIAWRISKEKFFKVDWISDLKIRASYGELGINTLGSWEYIGLLNSYPRAIYGVNQTPIVGQYQAQLTSPDLHWEKRIVKNIGFDAALFNNRLIVTAEVYNSLSKDVLLNNPLPAFLGNAGGNPSVNAASIRNTGFELSATYRSSANAIKWDITANATTIKNRVVGLGNQAAGRNYLQTVLTRTQFGRSIGEWFVLRTNGLFQSQADVTSYKSKNGQIIQPNAKPGDIRYVDLNGDGQINNDDRDFYGSPWPTLQTGAQFNASYKQFSLNIQLVGVFGLKIYNDVRRVLDSYQNTNFRKDINPWTPTNTNTGDPRLAVQENDPGVSDNNRSETDRWIENGSYVRLRNVELGYTFPNSLVNRVGFNTARIYVSGQNLLTLTKYTGPDPDIIGSTDINPQTRILDRGVDAGNWPASRIISVGIQCEF